MGGWRPDLWFHLDGTECIAPPGLNSDECATGGGPIFSSFEAAQVGRVRALHRKADKPMRVYDKPCPAHAFDPETRTIASFEDVRDCSDCGCREVEICSHCECPNDEWPCPTIRALEGPGLAKLREADAAYRSVAT